MILIHMPKIVNDIFVGVDAVALDLDGTVFDLEEKTNKKIVELIKQLISKKITIIICTARNIDSTLKLLATVFGDTELSKMFYICSAGYEIYTYKNAGIENIFVAEYNEMNIIDVLKGLDFFRENYLSMKKKDFAFLFPTENIVTAKKIVCDLYEKLLNSSVKCYSYHDQVVFSGKDVDKEITLNYLIKRLSLRKCVCIADQGDVFEADYEFLRGLNGYTVGTRDVSNKEGCKNVYDKEGNHLQGLKGTEYLLSQINLKV